MASSTVYIKVGRKLRALRKKAELSQERLALDASLSRTYVGSIEVGKKRASLETLEKLAKALGVELVEFFKF